MVKLTELIEVESIDDARYVIIGKPLTGITVGKLYELKVGQAIGLSAKTCEYLDISEKYLINDIGNRMTIDGVAKMYNCQYYK